jgi:drug/metabolite transporter, DME family
MRESLSATSRGPALGFAAIAGAATLWAIAAAVAADLFDAGVEPLELVQARAYVATAGLALLPAGWRRKRRETWRLGPPLLGLSIALVNAAYYLALDHLAVAVAIVLQYTAPALVVIWIALRTRRSPARDVGAAVIGALAGVVLVSGLWGGGLGGIDTFGVAMGMGAAVMFATYTLVSERVGEDYGVIGGLLRGFAWASAGWLLFQIPRGFPDALVDGSNLPRVLFVGIGGTLAPFLLFLWGVQRVRAERAAIAATLEPVVAAAVAWIWLGQSLSGLQLLGGALVIVAVASLQIGRRRVALAPEP